MIQQEVDLNARRTHRLNIAETIARKLEMNYVFGREFEELVQRSREDSLAKSGEPSRPTFHSIEADAFADYALPFIHSTVFGDSFALYLCM